MRNNFRTARSVVLAVASMGFCLGAQAGPGTSLLSPGYQAQLETWLGEGNLALTNIYSKAAGDTSLDFHKASDGKGRTFSVMEATNSSGKTWLVGGYNPQSWSSTDGMHVTMDDSQRTAFLFNLTAGFRLQQLPQYFNGDGIGKDQTYNQSNYGPTFGYGHDLYVPQDLTHGGSSFLYTYNYPGQSLTGLSLLDGSTWHGNDVTFGAIQVFTISAVPEPATYGLLLAGLLVLLVRQRGRATARVA
ncbi:PEP_CTERM-anchored TLD domain-containing protein [Janthinobacterium lividum]|uniref:PEP_CTERM-anchored TLD domain-containing protein n=1 Tax=Janthinobacterium lividum TaxID=29581 RepID=A0ABU0XVW2_9BURK|nr:MULTISPECIES: PEP_CTERM-anchored TLD domain-containing protein [Janthinobacterium]MCC7698843.1 PEP_CTERM-anchored TLD domain-containing protein [Janthinobacterium sp. EB271-G4-7A]MDQ4627695.1 PEP_CTERM-anchored TLD domain-containing protein [Janthinobacterium lividum]MDQ4676513.1 PEP_CTERM-anchored TLD domain-containing protein [Janthinobacterium lividum]MDQ4687015.1 PEP_CTERM-anchored TLD domain-containing protein [Janthinobacterium lividum]